MYLMTISTIILCLMNPRKKNRNGLAEVASPFLFTEITRDLYGNLII